MFTRAPPGADVPGAPREALEDFITARIENGASIIGNYPPDETTLAEFEEHKRKG